LLPEHVMVELGSPQTVRHHPNLVLHTPSCFML